MQGAGCRAVGLAQPGLPMPHQALAAAQSRGCPAVPVPSLCRCWTTNNNMGFWWILRFPVFLAILVSPGLRLCPPQPLARHLRGPRACCERGCPGQGTELPCLPLPDPAQPCPSWLTLLRCRSTSSSSSASSRSSSPSSARTKCATRTTSSGGWWAEPRPPRPVVHTLGGGVHVCAHPMTLPADGPPSTQAGQVHADADPTAGHP